MEFSLIFFIQNNSKIDLSGWITSLLAFYNLQTLQSVIGAFIFHCLSLFHYKSSNAWLKPTVISFSHIFLSRFASLPWGIVFSFMSPSYACFHFAHGLNLNFVYYMCSVSNRIKKCEKRFGSVSMKNKINELRDSAWNLHFQEPPIVFFSFLEIMKFCICHLETIKWSSLKLQPKTK